MVGSGNRWHRSNDEKCDIKWSEVKGLIIPTAHSFYVSNLCQKLLLKTSAATEQ